MKRAPIVEDWSRFNRAVLEIADGRPEPAAPPKQPAPRQQTQEPRVSEPGEHADTYGLVARHNWRKLA